MAYVAAAKLIRPPTWVIFVDTFNRGKMLTIGLGDSIRHEVKGEGGEEQNLPFAGGQVIVTRQLILPSSRMTQAYCNGCCYVRRGSEIRDGPEKLSHYGDATNHIKICEWGHVFTSNLSVKVMPTYNVFIL